ncbi:MAG: hypothetical protein IKN12_06350 [Selenomonadaceae bacterium]|nr:hypothetical protein [Selenomonadaceae bacterium]
MEENIKSKLCEWWRFKKISWQMVWSDFDTTNEFWVPVIVSAVTSFIVVLLATTSLR